MTASHTLPGKVVFDSPLADAFLFMAQEEGLIEDDGQVTDGWLRSHTRTPPTVAVRRLVLEQIALTPQVVWPNRLPERGLSGMLIDEQVLIKPAAERGNPVETQRMTIEWVVAMLSARGIEMSASEVCRRNDQVVEACRTRDRIEQMRGSRFPDPLVRMIRTFMARPGLPEWRPFTSDDMDALGSFEVAFEMWKPIYGCINSFANTATIAQECEALLRVPFSLGQSHDSPQLSRLDANERYSHVLVSVVSDALTHSPFRPTLRETLVLAQDSATIALREQLAHWKGALESSDESEIALVGRELRIAQRAIKAASGLDQATRYITLVSVPIGSLGFFLPGLLGTLPGVAVAVAGALTQETASGLREKYRWAMFGQC